jgi:hypothetical protein
MLRRTACSENRPLRCRAHGFGFSVTDSAGQKLAFIYFEEEPGRRAAAKLFTPAFRRLLMDSALICRPLRQITSYMASARVAQNEFAGHFKTVRITDSHAAIKLVHNEAVVRRRVRLGHNDPNVPKGPPHRATRLPDHGVTYRLVKNPHAPSVKLPTRKLRPT